MKYDIKFIESASDKNAGPVLITLYTLPPGPIVGLYLSMSFPVLADIWGNISGGNTK